MVCLWFVCARAFAAKDAAFAALNVTFSCSDNCTFAASNVHFTVASTYLLFASAELSPKAILQGEGEKQNKKKTTVWKLIW